MKKAITTLMLMAAISAPAIAEESSIESAKNKVADITDNVVESGKDLFGKASDKTGELAENATEIGKSASEKAKEVGSDIWSSVKKATNTAAEYVEEGAAKVKKATTDENTSDSSSPDQKCEESFFNSCSDEK